MCAKEYEAAGCHWAPYIHSLHSNTNEIPITIVTLWHMFKNIDMGNYI
jgi:hypothetical protein